MRVAIVGTGYIAGVHARIVRDLGGKVVAVCGRSLASASAFGFGQAYDNLASLLAKQGPDVVHLCTPNHLHAEQAITAFAAGAHVLVEKPMAHSSEAALRMIEAADVAGRVGAMVYNYRGYPLIAILRDRVRRGEFGLIRRAGGCYLSDDVHDPETYVWHFTPGSVGPAFALMDLGIHWFDLVEYVSGLKIREITAQLSTHQPKRTWRGRAGEGPRPPGQAAGDGAVIVNVELEDQADLLIRLDNGAAGSATISACSIGHPNRLVIAVDGSEAGFDWNQETPNTYQERSAEGTLVRQRSPDELPAGARAMSFLPAGHAEGYLDAFRNVVASAWRGMAEGEAGFPTFADGLRGVRLVEAAVVSAAEGRTVDVASV
jgi:predicted dehydrogenase